MYAFSQSDCSINSYYLHQFDVGWHYAMADYVFSAFHHFLFLCVEEVFA